MAGRLYGVGVGPGDPELVTLKALKVIKECGVIAFPGKDPEESTAYNIALGACPEIRNKELFGIYMPMSKDEGLLRKSHEEGAEILCGILDQGKDIAFLTLGDAALYSTYIYLHEEVIKRGYDAKIISGITSLSAAAAAFGISLAQKDEELHVIPASYEIKEALALPGTKVLMKAGRKIKEIKEILTESGAFAVMAENCTMEGERIYKGAENFPDDAGYYSLMIIKEDM